MMMINLNISSMYLVSQFFTAYAAATIYKYNTSKQCVCCILRHFFRLDFGLISYSQVFHKCCRLYFC